MNAPSKTRVRKAGLQAFIFRLKYVVSRRLSHFIAALSLRVSRAPATKLSPMNHRSNFDVVGTWGSMIALIAMFILGAKPGNYAPFLVILVFQACMVGITNNIQNPMIADCADYEHYRSGKFIPGIVGTVFTLVDQVISAFSSTIVGLALAFAGMANGKIPTDTYISDKFYWTMMFCFCIIPIVGHIASIISMKFYPLTKEKMVEIQAELVIRKEKALAEQTQETAVAK